MEIKEFIENERNETTDHCKRVAKYIEMFFKYDDLNFTDEEKRCIIKGAYLHDIGKAYVDDNILYKEGKLTTNEFQKVKEHSLLGYEILIENKKFFKTQKEWKICSEIVLLHHKKIDGSGYPSIKIKKIPLYVQLVSIVDIFDVLTTPRCYKKAYSKEEAIAIIKNGECGAFNKRLTNGLKKYLTVIESC